MIKWKILKGVKFLLFFTAAAAGMSFAVMLLWNELIPALFHGPALNFWQAAGLLVLSHILFRGFRPHHHGWQREIWHKRMEEKLASMTPEERKKFKSQFGRHRCGGRHHADMQEKSSET